MTDASVRRVFKLCKKYGSDDPVSTPIVNVYLDAEEHAVLAKLPGRPLAKRRYRYGGFAIDRFEGLLDSLVLAEIGFPSREQVMGAGTPAPLVQH